MRKVVSAWLLVFGACTADNSGYVPTQPGADASRGAIADLAVAPAELGAAGDMAVRGAPPDLARERDLAIAPRLIFIGPSLPASELAAQADKECISEAANAHLVGTYGAFLGGLHGGSPAVLLRSHRPILRVDGVRVATDDTLFGGALEAPILLHADGLPYYGWLWTGFDAMGNATGGDCHGWTQVNGAATYGEGGKMDSRWAMSQGMGMPFTDCISEYPFYCIEM